MDEMTQQNAALVGQAAVVAQSLQDQAGKLVELVGTYKLVQGGPVAGQHSHHRADVTSFPTKTETKIALASLAA